MNANHAARELLLNPDFVCRVRTIAQKQSFLATPNLQFVAHKIKGLRRARE
jgi:hypothetical protein